jgi:hypothetical protein
MQENYEPEELEDIERYGAQNGFHGMIYYSETCALYEEYHDDIWTMINDDADSMNDIICIDIPITLQDAN